MTFRTPTRVLAVAIFGLTASCTPSSPTPVLSVAAASSLAPVLESMDAKVMSPGGLEVAYTLGASGDLEAQLANGAPYDVFLSAGDAYVDRLIDAGVLDPATRTVFAEGRLFVVQNEDLEISLASLDDLTRPEVRRIALANPEHAPYGAAAREALHAAGVWDTLRGKVVFAETVQQAWEFVRSGNADVGLVSESLLMGTPLQHWAVPRALYTPPRYTAALRLNSPHRQAGAAFLGLLVCIENRSVLIDYGLQEPQGD